MSHRRVSSMEIHQTGHMRQGLGGIDQFVEQISLRYHTPLIASTLQLRPSGMDDERTSRHKVARELSVPNSKIEVLLKTW
jgi:hypothetical protein